MKLFRRIVELITPPQDWKLPVLFLIGILLGVLLVILRISNAVSYLSDDPQACMNCHVMTPQYATWQKSSHARVATCNDCHVPHDNFLRKYMFKAKDGLRHATMFTFRLEPEVIHIKEAGKTVVQENCIRCHGKLVNGTELICVTYENSTQGRGKLCWDCHRETPHGRVNSLSSFPFARVPGVTPVVPEWMNKFVKQNNVGVR
ncbi:MAG: cytochrome c nitrite reductase small subunit [Ignavibacteria bacterium]|nr:cytochrome c nitrite reductase small subunit [Ignavibacteria bacterium]